MVRIIHERRQKPPSDLFTFAAGRGMTDAQEHEIVSGLLAGKSQAWTSLYEGCFDRVWSLAARLIGPDTSAVADVVQETFLAAARSARSYDPDRGSLWTWLGGIARNLVAEHFRQRHRNRRVQEGGDLAGTAAETWADRLRRETQDPRSLHVAAEAAGFVRAALAHLDDDHRALLVAFYVEDTPVDQIARETGAGESAVRSRLARARQAFRAAFARVTQGSQP